LIKIDWLYVSEVCSPDDKRYVADS